MTRNKNPEGMHYVQVVINVPHINGTFDYHVPEVLAGKILAGCLVEVPFGKQSVQGIVLRQVSEPQIPKTRPISALLEEQPVLNAFQINLAVRMAAETLSPLSSWGSLMLPPGLSQHADTLYTLLSAQSNSEIHFSPLQEKMISLFQTRGSALRGNQLEYAFKHHKWKPALQKLIDHGLIKSQAVLQAPSVRARTIRTVQLGCTPEEALARLEETGRAGSTAQERRRAILQFLIQEPWPVDAAWVYAGSGGNAQDIKFLADNGLVQLGESEIWRDPLENIHETPQLIPQLTEGQAQVWRVVESQLENNLPFSPMLLHGVTSSGKTEIYLRAAEAMLRQNKQVIILVPEISLTPQTVRRFLGRFPGQVGLVHSRLSPGERYDTWRRARTGQLPIIVGPRSALFTPLDRLGLIIIDECHDDSYYQNDLSPFYNTLNAALIYREISGCKVLMGSATPTISLLYQAQQEKWTLLHLPQRILAHRQFEQSIAVPSQKAENLSLPLPPIETIDMRQELKEGNRSIFSRALEKSLRQVLEQEQQAILFLNRRGAATYIFCRDCGHTLLCPRCNLPLTLHNAEDRNSILICHTCNYRRQMPRLCPQCKSTRIREYGMGTEKVEGEVLKLLPQARVLRLDAGTVKAHDAHEILLTHFANHQADILIGTQMLAKGLDLPLVTLVGVILADVGLNLPDYRAPERTFQLLTQVAGRAGRSPLGGKVIFQTFQPELYPIQAAANYDFEGFYQRELAYRRKTGYPPFSRLVRLEYRHKQVEQAEATAQAFAKQLQHWIEVEQYASTDLIGPVPCFYQRLRGEYRWQIILRGPNPLELLRNKPLENWRVEIDPPSLL